MGNRTPESVINAMRKKGRTLHLQYRWHGEDWRLDDGSSVHSEVARIVTKSRNVASVGDALFAGAPAQTWRFVEMPKVVRRQ
jgi:hypothetical protein